MMHFMNSLSNNQLLVFVISSLDRIILVIHESDHPGHADENKSFRTRLHRISGVDFELNTH